VRYGENDALLGRLEKEGPERWLMRKLQRYSVNIPKRLFAQLEKQGDVRAIRPGIYVQVGDTLYDQTLGVVMDGKIAADDLVV
jgi:CRISPR-associated endonuclease/helicase Cas3